MMLKWTVRGFLVPFFLPTYVYFDISIWAQSQLQSQVNKEDVLFVPICPWVKNILHLNCLRKNSGTESCERFRLEMFQFQDYFILNNHCKDTRVVIDYDCYRMPKKLQEGNVSSRICLLTVGVPRDHYPWCIGPHCTESPSPSPAPPLDMGPHCTGTPISADIWWLWSIYGRQADGMHPSGMVSCFLF